MLAALGLAACQKGGAAKGPELALDAPIPAEVPAGTVLVIGDPTTQKVIEHNGWQKELPFKITWAQISGGPAVTEAFHAGALDVGSAANMPPIHATFVGIPVKTVAVTLRQDPAAHPAWVLAVSPKARIAKLSDLKGKKIAFSAGQVQGEVVLRVLQKAGLTTKDVTLVELPSTGDVYPNALASGLVDAAPLGSGVSAKRYLDNYGRDGAKVLSHEGAFRDDLGLLYVRDETLKDPAKAAALREYIKLWGRAQAWKEAHRDEWTELYFVQNQGLSPEDARHIVESTGHTVVPRDWAEARRMQQGSIDLMAAQMGQKPFDAARIFDPRFETVGAEAFEKALPASTASAAP